MSTISLCESASGSLPTDRIKVRFHYLRDTNTEEFQFSEEERQEARWRIGEDFALMQEKSSDPIFNIADPGLLSGADGLSLF